MGPSAALWPPWALARRRSCGPQTARVAKFGLLSSGADPMRSVVGTVALLLAACGGSAPNEPVVSRAAAAASDTTTPAGKTADPELLKAEIATMKQRLAILCVRPHEPRPFTHHNPPFVPQIRATAGRARHGQLCGPLDNHDR